MRYGSDEDIGPNMPITPSIFVNVHVGGTNPILDISL